MDRMSPYLTEHANAGLHLIALYVGLKYIFDVATGRLSTVGAAILFAAALALLVADRVYERVTNER